jgi:hypothetical protein
VLVERTGPPETQRADHEVDYLRRTPLRRGLLRRRPKEARERYIDTGAPSFRGPGEDNVSYVRRTRLHRPWWRRPVVIIPLILLVLIAAAGTFVLTQRNVSTEVPLAKVVERFEARQPEVTQDTDVEAIEQDEEARRSTAASPGSTTSESGDVAAVAELPPDEDPYTIPEEGVYIYATSGGEEISLFGARHTYPSRTFATIRHFGGCRWEQRIDVIEEHTDVRKLCSRPDEMLQVAQARYVTFFGQREGGELVCEPWVSLHALEEDKGRQTTGVCRGAEGEAHLTRTFVGIEPFVIEGEIEQAVRISTVGKISGTHRGTSHDEMWLSRKSGLPFRWERTVDVVSSAYGANVRYTEDASFVLQSLDPQR